VLRYGVGEEKGRERSFYTRGKGTLNVGSFSYGLAMAASSTGYAATTSIAPHMMTAPFVLSFISFSFF
jgi:hypothetical protein